MTASTLTITGFRCFEHLHIADLGRVNLVVGRNNAGKTCLLEAVEAVGSSDLRTPIKPMLRRRLERQDRAAVELIRGSATTHLPFVAPLFHGRRLDASRRATVTFDASTLSLFVEPSDDHEGFFVVESSGPAFRDRRNLPLDRGAVRLEGWLDGHDLDPALEAVWFGVRGLDDIDIEGLWREIGLTWAEDLVLDAIRLIAPEAKRIGVVDDEVLVRTPRGRHRLGDFGEGTGRIAALVMVVAAARRFALIDEIDTGLHHSVQADMWRLVTHTARHADNLVFATTHSEDCLRGVATLHDTNPDLASDLRVHRLEPGRVVSLTAADVAQARELDLELRGR